MTRAEALGRLVDRSEILVCPGVHDPLTGRIADSFDFDAIYVTGYGTSVATLGYADAGLVTMPEMVRNASNVAARVSVPVIADADDGYGGPLNVARTVRAYARSGVAGIHIEDQVAPKGTGRVRPSRVLPFDGAMATVRAAVSARDDAEDDLVLIGRTDAIGAENGGVEEAIRRANGALDHGMDLAFVLGQRSAEEVARIGEAVDGPLLYDCNANHPQLEPGELEALGYDVVIYPTISTHATILAVHEAVSALADEGSSVVFDLADEIDGRSDLDADAVTGLAEAEEAERRFAPEADDGDQDGGRAS